MPRGDRGGHPTYWTTFGQGPRPALMIHCALAESSVWGGMARHLSGALSMTAFDLPGHGRSGDWDGVGEIQAQCVRIAADFAARAGGPLDVIGHSFGATVALRLALEHPGALRSLVLIEPVLFAVAGRAKGDGDAAFAEAMRAGDMERAARDFTALWGTGARWEDIAQAQQAKLTAQMPLIAASAPALYDDIGGMLRPGGLEGLDLPVLLLEGSRAPAVISAINDGLAARLARAERSIIGGAGHMAPVTHPAQLSAEILRFLHAIG